MKPASPSIEKRRQAAVDPVRKVMRQTRMEPGHMGLAARMKLPEPILMSPEVELNHADDR